MPEWHGITLRDTPHVCQTVTVILGTVMVQQLVAQQNTQMPMCAPVSATTHGPGFCMVCILPFTNRCRHQHVLAHADRISTHFRPAIEVIKSTGTILCCNAQ